MAPPRFTAATFRKNDSDILLSRPHLIAAGQFPVTTRDTVPFVFLGHPPGIFKWPRWPRSSRASTIITDYRRQTPRKIRCIFFVMQFAIRRDCFSKLTNRGVSRSGRSIDRHRERLERYMARERDHVIRVQAEFYGIVRLTDSKRGISRKSETKKREAKEASIRKARNSFSLAVRCFFLKKESF